MNLTPQEKLTVDTYNTIAKDWANKHFTLDFWQEEIEIFKKYLPNGKILEVGCGGGRDAMALTQNGFDYIGTDIAQGLIDAAKLKNPNLNFFNISVYDLNFTEKFDGFWASAVLLHIPKNKINMALSKIKSVVKDNGIGFITIKQGVDEKIEFEEDNPNWPRLFVYYSKEEFQEVLENNGFEVLEVQIKPMSAKTIWLIYYVKVRAKINQADLYKNQISLSEWFEKLGYENIEEFRKEDNDKRERLAVLNEIIELPFDKPYQFSASYLSEQPKEFKTFFK